ncbi:hypothetical protein ACWDUG_24125, partial [Streptomyces cellulosae]
GPRSRPAGPGGAMCAFSICASMPIRPASMLLGNAKLPHWPATRGFCVSGVSRRPPQEKFRRRG